jgi:hypothetical protein
MKVCKKHISRLERGVTYQIVDDRECEFCHPTITSKMKEELEFWDSISMDAWAKTEDYLRTSKVKSIRSQGKYKGRGKEKKHEP